MDIDERAKKIKEWAQKYAERKGFELYPDEKRVDEVVQGLAARQEKFGKRYCPCRIITGNAIEDRKIICPCAYHEEELKKGETCHCRLFVTKEFKEAATGETDG
jgi:ferredoxin-thioredoxin reductase catalytic subunit